MTPERWSRIKEVFNTALERDESVRSVFLDGACGSDDELRQEVERLLQQEGEPTAIGSPVRRRDVSGQTLAHYQVISKIGEGGMGAVYRARDTHLDRYVAIKVLPADKVSDASRRQRFVQEAKSASSLNHPNIIHIYDISEQEGLDFIAMEYVEGKTLDELIPGRGTRPRDLLRYAVQIADALAAAHGAGIVHRDLKPGNLIVDAEGRVKVLDFGLAKLTESTKAPLDEETRTLQGPDRPHTEQGVILGTAAYMSPEQAEGREVDARSDIFSFGVLLYEMITGNRPFRGESWLSIITAVAQQDPEPLPEETPPDLRRIVGMCLRKDPARRYQHMADIKVALETLKEESESGSLPMTAPSAKPASLSKLVLALLSIVVLTALGWVFFFRSPATPELPPPSIVQLTSMPGIEDEPTFSPNGDRVVFSHLPPSGKNPDLYVMDVEDGTPIQLTDNPTWENSPAWSPDGRWIAFGSSETTDMGIAQRGSVSLISPLGGPQRKLTDINGGAAGISWSPDGRWLAVSEFVFGGESGLCLVSVDDGKKRRLTTATYPQADGFPAFSPDGRYLAYAPTNPSGPSSLLVVELDFESGSFVGEPRQLLSTSGLLPGLTWTPDGRHVVYAELRSYPSTGKSRLLRTSVFEADEERSERLEFHTQGAMTPAISGAASRLVFSRSRQETDIWRYRLGERAKKFISSTVSDFTARYSPDGSRIAFVSERAGSEGAIWTCNADGTEVTRLIGSDRGNQRDPAWSPDGQWIAFSEETANGEFRVLVVGASGGTPRHVASDHPGGQLNPSWSAEGESIYFVHHHEGSYGLMRIPVEGGLLTRIADSDVFSAAESADGQTVYYARWDRGTTKSALFAQPVTGGLERLVLEDVHSEFWIGQAGIYYFTARTVAGRGGHSLRFHEFATGTSRELLQLESSGHSPTVSPDGQTVLFTVEEPEEADLMLVENFR